MHLPIILAHGALGGWDELIFLGVGAIFITMMGISWVKSRNSTVPLEEPEKTVPSEPAPTESDTDSPDHFRLE
ncbi:MAG: hypothetical protein ABI690_19070 [Chloroflexota bacterium]